MKRNIIIIIGIFLTLFTYSINYFDNESGISFNITDSITLLTSNNVEEINKLSNDLINKNPELQGAYYIQINKTRVSEYDYFRDRKKLHGINDNDLYKLKNGNYIFSDGLSHKFIKYNNEIVGELYYNFGTYYNGGVNYNYEIHKIIIHNDFVIEIDIDYFDTLYKIPPKYPEIFYYIPNQEWMFIEPKGKKDPLKDFYNLILSRSPKAPPELVKLLDYADVIEKSLVLTGKMYNPTIDNLRLRETSGDKGKVIRILSRKEQVELLEKGATATIDGAKGQWFKVKTAKGEIGWCFSAYLTEVEYKEEKKVIDNTGDGKIG